MTYLGIMGKRYSIVEPPIGRGGEGAVYKIEGESDKVVKIFNEKRRSNYKHEKLKAMVDFSISEEAKSYIVWPLDIVYENSCFAGCVFPLIKNKEDLNTIYSDKCSFTLYEKITIAKNLCVAINAVHNAGHICGDLNPRNIGVSIDNGKVTIMDVDSFHIVDRNYARIYRCEVGIPEYMSKEVQLKTHNGLSLSTAPLPTYTKYSDLFALAVHIFQLLMNGCHPYATAIDQTAQTSVSLEAPQPNENICNDFCPFIIKKDSYTTPVYAPKFSYLPDSIQKLFSRAFICTELTDRPGAIEWYYALTDLQNNLKTCTLNPKHFYPDQLDNCPWCTSDRSISFSPEPRMACVLLLDTSASMSGEPINNIINALYDFKEQTSFDELAQKRIDIAVVEFNDGARVAQNFVPLECLKSQVNCSSKVASEMGTGINLAIDIIKERNNLYARTGTLWYKPWIIMFSQDKSSDDISVARQKVIRMERDGKLTFYSINADNKFNIDSLGRSITKLCMNICDVSFKGIFESTWLVES